MLNHVYCDDLDFDVFGNDSLPERTPLTMDCSLISKEQPTITQARPP